MARASVSKTEGRGFESCHPCQQENGIERRVVGCRGVVARRGQQARWAMIARLTQYLRETSQEMKRVSWPSVTELKESTGIVLVTVAIITVFVYVVDKFLDFAMKQVITLT